MRDQWVSDHLDLAKWAIVHRLAADHGLQQVAHISFFRRSTPPLICHDGRDEPIDDVVWSYFRDWKRMEKQALAGLHVRILDADWSKPSSRPDYLAAAIQWLDGRHGSQLVLLDPDTGLAPAGGGGMEHVASAEVVDVWQALQAGEVLAIYQHAPRGRTGWVEHLRRNSYQALAVAMGDGVRFEVMHLKQDHPKAAIFWVRKGPAGGVD